MICGAVVGGQYRPLSESDIEAIHAASLEILGNIGVKVTHEEARARFAQAGARIEGERVRLSQALVEDALATIPHEVLLASRDGQRDLLLKGRRVHFGTGGSPTTVLPPGATAYRPAELRDVSLLAALADQLSELDFFILPVTPTDIAPQDIAVSRFYAALRHTTKHIMGGLINLQGARDVFDMCSRLAGGIEALRARPFISCMTSWMISPLTFDIEATDILTFWCEQGMPVALSAAPMAGSTAPITLAGTLTQLNAEQLAGMVYTQLVRKGTPVLAGYIPGQMDLRHGGYLGGTPEFALMQAAAAQLAQFYDVPLYCSAGMTDSKIPDQQAGYEKMQTLLLTAMAGASYIHHAFGLLENMNIVSYEQMVLDNDIVLQVKRVLRGIQVDAEHLAMEAIMRVGPGGHYLQDEHTLTHMRSEFVQPVLADRNNRSVWQENGATSSRERATRLVNDLLSRVRRYALPIEIGGADRERLLDDSK
ncbi:MAG: trimethylamine methyltransferase family protein [Anaerolineae bacterium]